MAERNLLLRTASALVAIPLLFALVLWHEPLGFAALVLLGVVIALGEFAQLALADQSRRARVVLVVLGTAFAAAVYWRPDRAYPAGLGVVVLLAIDGLTSSPGDLAAATRRL